MKLTGGKLQRLLLFGVLSMFLAACGGLGQDTWAGMTVDQEQDEVFISYEQFIAKLTPERSEDGDWDWDRVWTYPDSDNRGDMFFAPVSYDESRVFVGDYDGGVRAIDRQTGEEIWHYEQGGTNLLGFLSFGGSPDRIIGGVALSDERVFVPDEEGVFVLDIQTGERDDSWQLETERAVWSKPIYLPATEEEDAVLFVTSLDHYIYKINPSDATIIWRTELDGAITSTPTYDAERKVLFMGNLTGQVVAVDADDGDILDIYESVGWVWGAPTQVGDELYFADLDGYVYAVRFTDNEFQELWQYRVSDEGKLRASPLVSDELVVVGADDEVIYALERDSGNQEWERSVDGKALSDLYLASWAESEPQIVTGTNNKDRMLIRLALDNGEALGNAYRHED